MKQNLISTGQWLVTTLILAISLGAYGCADTASVSEDVAAPLSSLTVTPGGLQPAFFANTTNYAVNAPTSATSITVTASPKDNTAAVTIDGIVTTQRSVTLGSPGSTKTILIVVETLNGLGTTYTVTVTRLLSSDNNLSTLTVTPGSLAPTFTSSTLDYSVNVANTVGQVTVTATKADPGAVMLIESILISPVTIPGGTPSSGPVNIPLTGPGTNTVVRITVTAPNGSKKTYTVNVIRAALSGNNNLSGLTVSPGTLNPAFNTATTAYDVNDVSSSATAITVIAAPQDSSASVTINDQGGNSRSIPLPGGPSRTDIEVRVIAPNGTDKRYFITVNQPPPAAPPAPTVPPDLIQEDDSCLRIPITNQCFPGTSDEDNITNVTTPRFRIPQPVAGETPSLYVGGVKVLATFDQGTNTLKPTAALSDGTYPITYTVANVGGESAQSPPLIVTIDTFILGFP